MDVIDLGLKEYMEALAVQQDVLLKRIERRVPDTLLIVEHYPVITMGRSSLDNTVLDRRFFDEKGIEIIRTRRGGAITYHAPGQLVFYPVVDLRDKKRDISLYIDMIEKAVTSAFVSLGVPASCGGGRRGVWVEEKKIAFIGISLKNWVTYHGVSVNINNDIVPFEKIDPCGEAGIRVTSARIFLGKELDMSEAKNVFADAFTRVLEQEYSYVVEIA
jgi:lipoate-protein ligase B